MRTLVKAGGLNATAVCLSWKLVSFNTNTKALGRKNFTPWFRL